MPSGPRSGRLVFRPRGGVASSRPTAGGDCGCASDHWPQCEGPVVPVVAASPENAVGAGRQREFARSAGMFDRAKWPWPIYAFYLGQLSTEELARRPFPARTRNRTRLERLCDVAFQMGLYQLEKASRGTSTVALAIGCRPLPYERGLLSTSSHPGIGLPEAARWFVPAPGCEDHRGRAMRPVGREQPRSGTAEVDARRAGQRDQAEAGRAGL